MALAATLSHLYTPHTALLMHTSPYQPSESGSTSASANSIDPMDLVVIRKRSRSPSLAPSSTADDHDTYADLDLDLDPELEDDTKSHGRRSSERSASPSANRKPMRKRAKTQEEKELRAQERIMRNRLAAQTSRQRKREYVTTMEQENTKLKTRLSSLARENKTLKADMQVLNNRLESMEQMFRFLTAPGTASIFEEQVRGVSPVVETLLDVPPPNDHLLTPNNILSHLSHTSPQAMSAGKEADSLLSPEQRIPAVNVDQQRHSATQTARMSLLLQRLTQHRPHLLRQMSQCLLLMAQMANLQKTFKQHSLLLFSTILFKQSLSLLHWWTQHSNQQPSSQPRSHSMLPSGPPGARLISAATEGQQAASVLAQAQCVLVLCAAHVACASQKGSVEGELTGFQEARDLEDLSAAVRERQQ